MPPSVRVECTFPASISTLHAALTVTQLTIIIDQTDSLLKSIGPIKLSPGTLHHHPLHSLYRLFCQTVKEKDETEGLLC